MELLKPGRTFDFMKYRRVAFTASALACLGTIVLYFVPGPNWGIDFRGGTELQVVFRGAVSSDELRTELEHVGYRRPDVVSVGSGTNEFLLRVEETNSLTPAEEARLQSTLRQRVTGVTLEAFEASPGGDKVSLKFSGAVEPQQIADALEAGGAGVRVLDGAPAVTAFGKPADHRYEAQLRGVADELIVKLREALGARGPEEPRRVEWVGPRAGAQLRDAALKSLLYTIAFIMVYVAFRFDLRFAPGGIIALVHDALITVGVYILLRKEVNLTLVAALLTIIGYSINDTIVIYDRIRENMARLKDQSLRELINVSTSQMLGRTLLTSSVTLLSILAFFVWGTDSIRDMTLALLIGMVSGVYSTIYIAAPVTEWMDRKVFRRFRAA